MVISACDKQFIEWMTDIFILFLPLETYDFKCYIYL